MENSSFNNDNKSTQKYSTKKETNNGQKEVTEDALSRRLLLRASTAVGASVLTPLSLSRATANEREGEIRPGSTIRASQFSDNLSQSIATDSFANVVTSTSFSGVTEQAVRFDSTVNNGNGIQGFPLEGDEFVVLSSGDANDASQDPSYFASTGFSDGRSFSDYSPDGYDAYNVADIEITFQVPEDAQGVAFDYRFATDESPSFLNSEFQDFFEAVLFTSDDFENIGLINGQSATVDTADEVANTPGGGSQNPTEPLPDPPDTAYNAVTDILTASQDISAYQGEELTLLFRVADASDRIYDSAVFLDNLRFTNEVETDPDSLKVALEDYEAAFKNLLDSQFQAQAHYMAILYNELGNSFASTLVDSWGYRAGEVPESELDDETIAAFDTIVNTVNEKGDFQITQTRALALYEFYDELFADLDPETDLETLKTQMTDYHVGRVSGQEAPLIFDNGNTFFDIVDQNWEVQADVLDELQSNYQLNGSDYQILAAAVNNLVDRFEGRANRLVRQKEKQAQEVLENLEDNTFEVHMQTLDSGVDSDAIEEESITGGVAAIIAIVGLGTLGFLTGYVGTKCTGGYTLEYSIEGVETTELSVSNPLADSWGTGLNLGAILNSYTTNSELEPEATSFLGGFTSGATVASKDLLLDLLVLNLQWGAASVADADLELDLPDIEEEEDLGFLGSMWDWVTSLWSADNANKARIGKAEGTLTVTNTSDVEYVPNFSVEYTGTTATDIVEAGYAPQIEGDESPMVGGETRDYTVTYRAPLDSDLMSGKLRVDLAVSPTIDIPTGWDDAIPLGLCETDYYALQKETAVDNFQINQEATEQTVAEGAMQDGESESYTYTVAEDAQSTIIRLNYPGQSHYSDLHVYDSNGNHTGYNYDTNEIETEIPNSTHSGRDTGSDETEWVTIEGDLETEYEVEIVTPEVGTVIQSIETQATTIEYDVDSTEVPELSPKLSTSGGFLLEAVERSEEPTFSMAVRETNGDNALGEVTLSASGFEHEGGTATIDAGNVSFAQETVQLDAGGSSVVDGSVFVPDDAFEGSYSGTIEVAAENGDTKTVEPTITVNIPVSEFTNNDGFVQTPGLRDAIGAWRDGVIKTDTLRDTIAAWRSDDPVA